MKICILTSAHSVNDVRVYFKVARSFTSAGHEVTWVGPGLHSDLGKGERGEREVVSYKLLPPSKSAFDRLMVSRGLKRVFDTIGKIDLIYTPDPDAVSTALDLGRNCRAKVLFDIHERYHGALLDNWLGPLATEWTRRLVRDRIRGLAHRADAVMSVNQELLREYAAQHSNAFVVRNCPPAWFAASSGAALDSKGDMPFRIMHGKVHETRGTAVVLDAAELATRKKAGLQVVMFDSPMIGDRGGATSSIRSRINSMAESGAVDLKPSLPMSRIPEVLQTCRVGVIAYGRALAEDSLPNRLFEYMAAGIPVIAPSYAKPIAAVVQQHDCGLLVDCEDSIAIAEAIVSLSSDGNLAGRLGSNGRRAFLEKYNWETEFAPVLDWIAKL